MKIQKTWIGIIAILALMLIYQFLFPLPPQTNLIRFSALAAFFLLSLSLVVGPALVCFGAKCAPMLKHRRRIGVLSFVFVLIHFVMVFVYSYGLQLSTLFSLPSTIIALIALIILFLLAITSFDKAMQKMGFSKWKLLQRFTYIAFALSFIHFAYDTNGMFIPLAEGIVFLNLAEVLMIIFGFVAIVLQFAGFFTKLKKNAAAKKASASETKTEPDPPIAGEKENN